MWLLDFVQKLVASIHTHVYMYTYIQIDMYIHTCIHTYTYTQTYVWKHKHAHAYIFSYFAAHNLMTSLHPSCCRHWGWGGCDYGIQGYLSRITQQPKHSVCVCSVGQDHYLKNSVTNSPNLVKICIHICNGPNIECSKFHANWLQTKLTFGIFPP